MHYNTLVAPLSSCTFLGFQQGSYVLGCYAMDVSTLCDEEEPLSMDEAMKSKNWLADILQLEYAIKLQSKNDAT